VTGLKSILRDTTGQSEEYLQSLYTRAFQRHPFTALCAVLRVGGMSDAHWDPLEESIRGFDDFNWLLQQAQQHRGARAARRIALLMYCQAVEMSPAHEMLVDLLYAVAGSAYNAAPLHHLRQQRKSGTIPPSAKRKLNEIKRIALEAGESILKELIDSFFREDIRNAFSHSDYILGENFLRWTESGAPIDVSFENLDMLIDNCFAFYGALLRLQQEWLIGLARTRRFHRWPQYEVLELLRSGNPAIVYGFRVHFSNGAKATFARQAAGVEADNIFLPRQQNLWMYSGSGSFPSV